jgi:hypothetical protein
MHTGATTAGARRAVRKQCLRRTLLRLKSEACWFAAATYADAGRERRLCNDGSRRARKHYQQPTMPIVKPDAEVFASLNGACILVPDPAVSHEEAVHD